MLELYDAQAERLREADAVIEAYSTGVGDISALEREQIYAWHKEAIARHEARMQKPLTPAKE